MKKIEFDENIRNSMFSGIEKNAKAVGSTLGPMGRLVAIENTYGNPTLTKDGVTVSRAIELEDAFENMGSKILTEVATKTNDDVGDGTTTSTVLAYAMAKEGIKAVSSGVPPIQIKKGIDEASQVAVNMVDHVAKQVENIEDLVKVATISSNNDTTIGAIIAEAIEKVGTNGVITVGESSTMETNITYTEGMQFDRGFISPYFVTDPQRMIAELQNCYVLITDYAISNIRDILPILKEVSERNSPLMIVCDDMTGDALVTMITNNVKGNLKSCVVKAPYFGDTKKEFLQDLAVLLNTRVISQNLGDKLSAIKVDDLGMCKGVKVTKDTTTFIDGFGDSEEIAKRIENIQKQIENEKSEYTIKQLKERLAKLSGGVAIINLGASTEIEMEEKKHRVEDTLSATRSAIEEGIVAGGGATLLAISNKMKKMLKSVDETKKVGYNIFIKALREPFHKILENAEIENFDTSNIDLEDIKVFNVLTESVGDPYDEGILDPAKVTKAVIRNASSVIGLFLMTNTGITIDRQEEKQ